MSDEKPKTWRIEDTFPVLKGYLLAALVALDQGVPVSCGQCSDEPCGRCESASRYAKWRKDADAFLKEIETRKGEKS